MSLLPAHIAPETDSVLTTALLYKQQWYCVLLSSHNDFETEITSMLPGLLAKALLCWQQ
jgi:hypothetical protein